MCRVARNPFFVEIPTRDSNSNDRDSNRPPRGSRERVDHTERDGGRDGRDGRDARNGVARGGGTSWADDDGDYDYDLSQASYSREAEDNAYNDDNDEDEGCTRGYDNDDDEDDEGGYGDNRRMERGNGAREGRGYDEGHTHQSSSRRQPNKREQAAIREFDKVIEMASKSAKPRPVDNFDELPASENLLRGIYSYGFEYLLLLFQLLFKNLYNKYCLLCCVELMYNRKPSSIQRRVIPAIISGKDTIMQVLIIINDVEQRRQQIINIKRHKVEQERQ